MNEPTRLISPKPEPNGWLLNHPSPPAKVVDNSENTVTTKVGGINPWLEGTYDEEVCFKLI